MANYGIKISQAGYDVKTADDINLIMKTSINMLKVFASGTISLSSTWNEVTHNLGYVPQSLVYIKDSASLIHFATAVWNYGVARADSTKLYIKQQGAGSTAYYYIFYEQA